MSRYLSELPARLAYLFFATALILSQHLAAWIVLEAHRPAPALDAEFWLTPLRTVLGLSSLSPLWAAGAFAYSLAVAWGVALLSFRRTGSNNYGYPLAVLSVVPVVQLAAIPLLALLPSRLREEPVAPESTQGSIHVVQGLLAGTSIIVLAVLVSAVTFGAYGWGLFVMTPFLVGITTATWSTGMPTRARAGRRRWSSARRDWAASRSWCWPWKGSFASC
jgi:hypothetical protein